MIRNNHESRQDILLDGKVSSLTTTQETTLLRRRTSLLKRILQFTAARAKYMPGLAEYLSTCPPLPDTLTSMPECIPLYLPSALTKNRHFKICIGGIDEIEERLRFAQASEALIQLRLQLMKRTVAVRYKSRTAESQ